MKIEERNDADVVLNKSALDKNSGSGAMLKNTNEHRTCLWRRTGQHGSLRGSQPENKSR